MRRLFWNGFDRKYVLMPVLVAAALVICALAVSETRRAYSQDLGKILEDHDDRVVEITTDVYGKPESPRLDALLESERARTRSGLTEWNAAGRMNTLIAAASALFALVLIAGIGLIATRAIRRNGLMNAELEALVSRRTAELQKLSEHMVRMIEVEKAGLARELHDELGGLLVAMRMDLSRLRKLAGATDADSLVRWNRIDSALTAGFELKRRVIENLRPTLLDNMGLVAAIRWQLEQSCEQGQIRLCLELPEEQVELDSDAAIAVFRTVQEAMANIIKHARARTVKVAMTWRDAVMEMAIEDDGVGMPADAGTRNGGHGLLQMKFRMRAAGGNMSIEPGLTTGTRVVLRIPAVIVPEKKVA